MRRLAPLFLAAALCLVAGRARAQEPVDITRFFRGSPESRSLTNAEIVAALKEALEIGTIHAADLSGKVDGYFGNPAIKIPLPSQLQTVEQGPGPGQGERVDALVLAMNRAAEKSAPAAKAIFWSAIDDMTFDNARKVLAGGDTAATDYFRERTAPTLTAAFRPVVDASMKEVGVVPQYRQLLGAYPAASPVLALPSFDIEAYVVTKALDGLFTVLGEQERKIRTDPAARVTSLLKKVFAK